MSELSRAEMDHLAQLSRLTLSNEEKENFAKQLPKILDFVGQLNAIAGLPQVTAEPAAMPLAKMRADEESGTQLSLKDLEKLAPVWRDNQVEVPAVFGEVADEG